MNSNSIRLARLLTMLPWLKQQKHVSVKEIARIFNISEKDVLTDLALLTFVGPDQAGGGLVDIQYTKDHVKVIDSQGLEKPLTLNRIEVISLLMGLKTLQDLEISNQATLSAINKLEVMGKEESTLTQISLDINRAIEENFIIEIEYLNFADNLISKREIEPHLIESDGSVLVLKAWCLVSNDWRTFRIDRIVSTRLTDKSFIGRDILENSEKPKFIISITLDSSAKWILDQFGLKAKSFQNESIEIELPIHSRTWLLRFLSACAFKILKIDLISNERDALLAALELNIERLRSN